MTTKDGRPAATTYIEDKPVRLGGMYDNKKGRHQTDSVYAVTQQRFEAHKDGISSTITSVQKDNYAAEPKTLKEQLCGRLVESGVVHGGEIGNHPYTTSEQRQKPEDYIESKDGTPPTLTTRLDILGYAENPPLRIRKLTPLETWRLQGFDDIAYLRAEQAGVSASQRYKQAGNSVTVNVICALLSQLGLGGKKWNEMTIEEREQLVQPKQENKK